MLDVILITHNRLEMLQACLDSIGKASQGYQINILLGLNGASSEYSAKVRSLAPRNSSILNFEKKLVGEARNELIKISKSAWIFFCDDDVILPIDIFKNFFTLLQDYPNSKVFGGPNLAPPNSNDIAKAQDVALGSKYVSGPFAKRYVKRRGEYLSSNLSAVTLCNLFWKKEENKFFPEKFTGGEELHLLNRTAKPFVISDKLMVFHERRTSWFEFLKQTFKYGVGRTEESPYFALLILFFPVPILLMPIYFLIFKNLKIVLAAFIIQYGYLAGLIAGLFRRH
jgi:glycosyltransferase involved in cell wall biosynthesis